MRRLILRNFQSPGDIVMLTAAVRDLHAAYPAQFLTDVRTSCPALWENNPNLSPLREDDPDVQCVDCHYPLIHRSNETPYHFLHGFIDYLNSQLGLAARPTAFRGDIHLSAAEKSWMSQVEELADCALPFWIVVAGGKKDFTIKWWDLTRYQQVVDHFAGRILFVQVGESGHEHGRLANALDLRGRTDLRQLIRLVYHAQGILSPVTLLMHLAAAVEVAPGRPKNRACVVVAGGREPPHWEAYPHHQFIHRAGTLWCCDNGGCWKSRVKALGDGDPNDRAENLCVDVVGDLPRCMDLVTVDDVIRAIEVYFAGGAISYLDSAQRAAAQCVLHGEAGPGRAALAVSDGDSNPAQTPPVPNYSQPVPESSPRLAGGTAPALNGGQAAATDRQGIEGTVRIGFGHGLGDCVHFAHVLQLYRRRGWELEIHYEENKRLVWQAAGARFADRRSCADHGWHYADDFNQPSVDGRWHGNKIAGNLNLAPLPRLGDVGQLWRELCDVDLEGSVNPFIAAEDARQAAEFVRGLPQPVVLLHTSGTNFPEEKNLPAGAASELYRALLERCDGTVVLLDWDFRVPTLAHARVRHMKRDWGHLGLGQLAALMNHAALLIGVDSGPYHFSSLTGVPTLGIFLDHHPCCVGLPRRKTANLTRGDGRRELNAAKRRPWNLVEYPGNSPRCEDIVRHAVRMLDGPRYGLPIGQDVMLQQWVRDWCDASTSMSPVADRNKTLDFLLAECRRRFSDPTIVETGCIRSFEDWSAGYSTYVFAAWLSGLGRGRLVSVDNSPGHCRFAAEAIAPWNERVTLECSDSVEWLRRPGSAIDVLYLDAMDTENPGCAAHGLREIQAAEGRLAADALVVYDDSPWNGCWIGKGAQGIPYLLERGWKVLASGYQTVLSRRGAVPTVH